MTEEIEKLETLVRVLNGELYEHFEHIDADVANCNMFILSSNGDGQEISFMEQVVWDSENDERSPACPSGPEDEDPGLEAVEVFVRRKMDTFIGHLSTIEFVKPEVLPVKDKWLKGVGMTPEDKK